KLQRTHNDAIALDGNGDGNDVVALFATATDSLKRAAIDGVHHFLVADAASARLFPVNGKAVVQEQRTRPITQPPPYAGLRLLQGGLLIAQNRPQLPCVEEQVYIAVIDPCTRLSRR